MIEQGGDPDRETFEEFWRNLRRALVYELKQRGLFTSSPSLLGIPGADSWNRDALEDLLASCFLFAVLKPLARLEHHLKVKSNIDGLIFGNIRNFLTETQQKHDRLGFRAFKILHEVIRRSLADGMLHVLEGNPKVRNNTVLGFSPDGNPGAAHAVVLAEYVSSWCDDLLPDLMEDTRGKRRKALMDGLRSHLEGLRHQGVEVFRFQALIQPFKTDLRQRWSRMDPLAGEELGLEEGGDEVVRLVRLVRQQPIFEVRDSFRKLLDCMDQSLDKLETKKKTKDYLQKLWGFLKKWADEESDEKLPAAQRLAQRLEIPRDRFRDLYAMLADMVKACQISSSGQDSVISQEGISHAASAAGGAAMNELSHQERLRTEMGKALSGLEEVHAATAGRGDGPPRVGEIFLVAATGRFPVEWAVVERDSADPGFVWVVPTDTHPLVGSADVAVPARGSLGPISLRCGFATRVAMEMFDPQLYFGRLEPEDLDRVRRKREEIAAGSHIPAEEELAVDGDPDYEDWQEEVLAIARAALSGEAGDAVEKPGTKVIAFPSRHWMSWASPSAAAASILLALTFGFGLVSQKQQIADLQKRLAESRFEVPLAGLPLTNFSTLRGIRGERVDITVPAEASHVLLLVDINDADPHPAYRLEIGESDTESHWTSDELPRKDVEDVSAVLPREFLPAGEYPFRVFGLREGKVNLVASFKLVVKVE